MLSTEKSDLVAVELGDPPARITQAVPVDLVRESYARYQRHDLGGVLALFSPAIEITQATGLPWSGRFRGHAGAGEFFTRLSEHTDAVLEPIIQVPEGNNVVVIGRWKGRVRASGRAIDLLGIHHWSIQNGQIVRLTAFVDMPAMQEALGAK